jgi:hypothetical protein
MNTPPVLRQVSVLSSLAVCTLVLHSVSAQAETVTTIPESVTAADTQVAADLAESQAKSSQLIIAESVDPESSEITYSTTPMVLALEPPTAVVAEAAPTVETAKESESSLISKEATPQPARTHAVIAIETAPTELPSVSTSASALTAQALPPADPDPIPSEEELPSPEEVVPTDVDPGRSTRSGPSYIGVAGNLGLIGDSALGDSNFAVISKIGLTRFLSLRPSAVIDFDDDATILAPVTLDFVPRQPGETAEELGFSVAPYIGAGAAFSTDGDVGPMITAGFDVPISPRFTANAAVNVGFLDDVDLGIMVGVGYNFPGLF